MPSNGDPTDGDEVTETGQQILTEARSWKEDVLENSSCTANDLPMMILTNRRDVDSAQTKEGSQLTDLAVSNGFTSW